MSDHHDEDDRQRGSGDTRFLDLEISKVLYNEAEGVTREAFRELLKDAAKERLRERFGDRRKDASSRARSIIRGDD